MILKTNSKAFEIPFHNYLIDAISNEENFICTSLKVQYLYETFESEFKNPYEMKRAKNNLQVCFSNWLQGLPSVLDIPFTNYDIIQLAKKYNSLESDASEKREQVIINNYFNFITLNYFKIFKNYKIKI